MSAACQQVNQLLAGLPPHSFDLKQVSGGSQIHSPLDKGHRGRHDACMRNQRTVGGVKSLMEWVEKRDRGVSIS